MLGAGLCWHEPPRTCSSRGVELVRTAERFPGNLPGPGSGPSHSSGMCVGKCSLFRGRDFEGVLGGGVTLLLSGCTLLLCSLNQGLEGHANHKGHWEAGEHRPGGWGG